MIAQFVSGIIEDLGKARQLRHDRRAEVWGYRFDEALEFFGRNGVALNGVTTSMQLCEALQGHLGLLRDPRSVGNEPLEAQIISYLKARGQYRA